MGNWILYAQNIGHLKTEFHEKVDIVYGLLTKFLDQYKNGEFKFFLNIKKKVLI